jgi:hypothetical protein
MKLLHHSFQPIISLLLFVCLIAVLISCSENNTTTDIKPPATEIIIEAFEKQRSGFMVEIRGKVTHLLKDDNDGSRHQRFIIELPNQHTLLIAHNIDLAERIPLNTGDKVIIFGQYEWNNKGGVIHWTHHDPENKHPGGWIKHRGKVYQ